MTTNEAIRQVRIAETFYCVEADAFAHQKLWEEWNAEVKWEQLNPGWLTTIGTLDGRPICVSMSWARICGRLVMFWEATSQVVDYAQIEKWFDANCAPRFGGRRSRTNATNFGHCIHSIREANEAPR